MKVRSRKKVDATFNMSSMTDIVFLLLIFFIVLSTFVSPPGVPVDLPKASNADVVPEATKITISIDADVKYYLNKKPMSYDALLSELQTMVGSSSSAAVKLSADGSIPLEKGIELFADVKKIGYTKVVIATQPKNE